MSRRILLRRRSTNRSWIREAAPTRSSEMRRCVGKVALAIALLGPWVVAGPAFGDAPKKAQAESDRSGWHGETMPEGLERGPVQGEYLWTRDQSVMVYVPAGEFIMGSEKGDADEQPVRKVNLDAYYIDKHEVSWRQWRLSGLPLPKDINGAPIKSFKPVWGRGDDMPMSYINWLDAQAYAEWVGKRLPTEAQWEKAARGTDGREYPWGDQLPGLERAVWKQHPIGKESPAVVTCCPEGASPYGALHMAGNIFEWCEDWYDSKFYARAPDRNPVNLEPGKYRVLRGGAFVLDQEDLRSALRNRQWPSEGQDYVGFRTVLSGASLEPQEP